MEANALTNVEHDYFRSANIKTQIGAFSLKNIILLIELKGGN